MEAKTQYYFLSGFTAKLAGTERGITEPTPTFSACFGQAFLELPKATPFPKFDLLISVLFFDSSRLFDFSYNCGPAETNSKIAVRMSGLRLQWKAEGLLRLPT